MGPGHPLPSVAMGPGHPLPSVAMGPGRPLPSVAMGPKASNVYPSQICVMIPYHQISSCHSLRHTSF